MVRRMSAQQARDNFGELIDSVRHGRDPVIVEKRGKPAVAVIPAEELEAYKDWRRERAIKAIEEVRAQFADMDPDEVYRMVTEEVDAYRREKREQREKLRLGAD